MAAPRIRTKRNNIKAPTRCDRSVQDSVGTRRSRQRVHGNSYSRMSRFHRDSVAVRRNTGWTTERRAVQNAQAGNGAVVSEAKARPKIIIHPVDTLTHRVQGWTYAIAARRHRCIPFGVSPPGRLRNRAHTCVKRRLLMERAREHGSRLIMHLPRQLRLGRRNHRRVGKKRNSSSLAGRSKNLHDTHGVNASRHTRIHSAAVKRASEHENYVNAASWKSFAMDEPAADASCCAHISCKAYAVPS